MKNSFRPKIFNDPIYGFISIPSQSCFDLIAHPFFQRLRRIRQLGVTHLVYPGALHTRFHHAIGAMHLMHRAINVLRDKGHEITDEEMNAACMAILLHDIGHGPYSHSLEYILARDVNHEFLSAKFMASFESTVPEMKMVLEIFNGTYHKKFLHQLVSSQLDVDRLDYLKRDSFYTGVSEGVISTERLISMLNVVNDELAVEIKGIYSVEKFLIARRLMYWQVYLHKTVVSSEKLLVNILKRAKELASEGVELFASPSLRVFLYNNYGKKDFDENPDLLNHFAQLDDSDIFLSVKIWMNHEDRILSTLAKNFVHRNLYKVELQSDAFDPKTISDLKEQFKKDLDLNDSEIKYFVFSDTVANNAYDPRIDRINMLLRDGSVVDVTEAADQLNVSALSDPVEKHFLCYPKSS